MDFIVIAVVNSLCRYAATYLRMILSATFGAMGAVIVCLVPQEYKFAANIVTYICIGMGMVRICAGNVAFAELIKGFLRCMLLHLCWGCNARFVLLYICRIYYQTGNCAWQGTDGISRSILWLLLLLYRQLVRIKVYSDKLCRVCCVLRGRKIYIKGFVDTGNVLQDPLFPEPVCIAQKDSFLEVLHEINDCTKVKYHVIPFSHWGVTAECLR